MKLFIKSTLIITTILLQLSFGTHPLPDCSILQNGTFRYENVEQEVIVEFTNNTMTETYVNGGYTLVANLNWEGDCSYTATIQSVNVPDFPFSVGDSMHVTVNQVEGGKVYYTSSINGDSWDGVLVKE